MPINLFFDDTFTVKYLKFQSSGRYLLFVQILYVFLTLNMLLKITMYGVVGRTLI